jgi:hypothetical protein
LCNFKHQVLRPAVGALIDGSVDVAGVLHIDTAQWCIAVEYPDIEKQSILTDGHIETVP